jgi:di/tricarboxylate transporter
MVDFDFVLVCIVLAFILASLYLEIIGPTYTFLGAIATLGLFGVLTPREILEGFANEQVWVIILLLMLGDIIRQTSIVEDLFDRLFRSARTYKGFLSRMMLIVSGFSAFLNNTPLVAVMMPYVNTWCKRKGISPSKFLMPLSFAAILGGSVTLIGTSTNLIVNGLLINQTVFPDHPSLNIFDFVWVGLPMVFIGYTYLVLFGEKLIPERVSALSEKNINTREYIVEARVRAKSYLIGKTLEESGLLSLKGLMVVELRRGHIRVTRISPQIELQADDLVILAGEIEIISALMNDRSGLSFPEVGMLHKRKNTEVLEVVISHNSQLINKKVKDINFRSEYDAAILSVHRNGEELQANIPNITLRSGDVLLLYAGDDFLKRSRISRDFYFFSKIKGFRKIEGWKMTLLLGGAVLAIILAAFHLVSLFNSLIILITGSLALKIARAKDLPKGVDYDLGLIIVMALALGTAMIKTGLAQVIAESFINVFLPLGKIWLLFAVFMATSIITAFITNAAAAGIVFPIALSVAHKLGVDPIPFVLTVAYAAAAVFMTPIGYQTNLMVYGPGGYKFKDFMKVGFPLTILYMIVTVVVLWFMYLR